MKRSVRRPWGRKHKGGWVILKEEFLKALKDASVAEIGEISVGAKQLRQIINLIPTEDCLLIKTNGRLEVETIDRVIRGDNGKRRTEFRKARMEHSFRLDNKAWMPEKPMLTVVIRPKKYA